MRDRVLFFLLMLSCIWFIGCSESPDTDDDSENDANAARDTIQEIADLVGSGPAVRIVAEDAIIAGDRIGAIYSFEIDAPLEHHLIFAVEMEVYEKNDNILIEADEVLRSTSLSFKIIKKGDTTSHNYAWYFKVPFTNRIVVRVVDANKRVDEFGRVRRGIGNVDVARKEGEERFPPDISIPDDYKFNPYRVGTPHEADIDSDKLFEAENE